MSTRAVLARTQHDGFVGTYHHWAGRPTALGQTLYHLHREQFSRDAATMMRTLIDEHPGGWSTIVHADWSQAPGFIEYSNRASPDAPHRAECFCHGDRHEGWDQPSVITDKDRQTWCEWAYAINERTAKMHVYKSYTMELPEELPEELPGQAHDTSTQAMVPMCFQTYWTWVCAVDLDGAQPDWKVIEGAGYERADAAKTRSQC